MKTPNATDNSKIIDIGHININSIGMLESQLLLAVIESNKIKIGTRVPAKTYSVSIKNNDEINSYRFTVDKDMMYSGVLNPATFNKKSSNLFQRLLAMADQSGGIDAGCVCLTSGENVELYHLKYGINPRNKFETVKYYDIVDQRSHHVIGSGRFGKVVSILGTIKPRFFNKKDMFFSPGEKSRLYKMQAKKENDTKD
jgi:hypothetical protein